MIFTTYSKVELTMKKINNNKINFLKKHVYLLIDVNLFNI